MSRVRLQPRAGSHFQSRHPRRGSHPSACGAVGATEGDPVPESRRGKKQAYAPPNKASDSAPSRVPVKLGGARWIALHGRDVP